MIAIVDYGAGNLTSVKKAFSFVGAETVVTSSAGALKSADKIVLPGVGHFSALGALELAGLRNVLLDSIRSGTPFLGICLGMQWLFEGSEESSNVAGAALMAGTCRKFPASVQSPHVGWNSLHAEPSSRLLSGIPPTAFVYYTHSFYAPVVESTTGETDYGLRFSGAVERGNIFGVQFHPEKSGNVGLRILRNFCEVA